ncbi:hypothetical protein [Actinomadura madurae]|uniref:hypothetical protein n=1 Tax=Actinomadura madurae TaxID=1993 RepID=UPI0020D2053F|nr:hypothetical protein [Actinomadura madurae]MCP9949243.1 hypothetical protein [Actinomadura madurae]MCQ0009988.1 hypothetical protein [Actinomadura madurae]
MTALLAGIAAVTVPLVLLASLAGQLRSTAALPSALRAHGVFPPALAGRRRGGRDRRGGGHGPRRRGGAAALA